ncbi:hypothetical protein GCM10023235_18960 [Kitasatospora terrestris]|uniref:Uncharacterized protein n=1 Tax=Kitasatospora terrestris TaxID=258051 RepID=A0ABP9DJ15_9ACTN
MLAIAALGVFAGALFRMTPPALRRRGPGASALVGGSRVPADGGRQRGPYEEVARRGRRAGIAMAVLAVVAVAFTVCSLRGI